MVFVYCWFMALCGCGCCFSIGGGLFAMFCLFGVLLLYMTSCLRLSDVLCCFVVNGLGVWLLVVVLCCLFTIVVLVVYLVLLVICGSSWRGLGFTCFGLVCCDGFRCFTMTFDLICLLNSAVFGLFEFVW